MRKKKKKKESIEPHIARWLILRIDFFFFRNQIESILEFELYLNDVIFLNEKVNFLLSQRK